MAFNPSQPSTMPTEFTPAPSDGGSDDKLLWGTDANGNPITKTRSEASNMLASLTKKQLSALKTAMVAAGWKTTSVSSQNSFWSSVLDDAVNKYSNDKRLDIWTVMSNYAARQAATGGSNTGGGGNPKPQTYLTLTDPATAQADLQKLTKNLLGRKATESEVKAYTKALNAAERKNATRTVYGSGGQTTTQSRFDPEEFTLGYVVKLAGGNFSDGQLGSTLSTIRGIADDYGLKPAMTNAQLKKFTKQLVLGELNEDTLREKFAKSAASLYGAFKDEIMGNPQQSARDSLNEYVGIYANLFDEDEDSVDISEVLKKASVSNNGTQERLSLADFQKTLRNDPKFETTTTAFREAEQLGVAFLRSMGVDI